MSVLLSFGLCCLSISLGHTLGAAAGRTSSGSLSCLNLSFQAGRQGCRGMGMPPGLGLNTS